MKRMHVVVISAVWSVVIVLCLRMSPPLLDFSAWHGAYDSYSESGELYNNQTLNETLSDSPDKYGVWFSESDLFEVSYFNPPSWLIELWVLSAGMNATVFTVVGVFTFLLAVGLSLRDRPPEEISLAFLGSLAFFVMFTGRDIITLGQVGVLVAGLVLLAGLYAKDKPILSGVAVGILTFKPHMAVAMIIPGMRNNRRQTLVAASVFTVLVFASFVVFSPSEWLSWVEFLSGSDSRGSVSSIDASLRTIFPKHNLPSSWNVYSTVLGISGSTLWSWKHKNATNATLMVFGLAAVIFMSGHAFNHDWLWVVMLPLLLGKSVRYFLGGLVAFCALTELLALEATTAWLQIVSVPSVAALALVIYLGCLTKLEDEDNTYRQTNLEQGCDSGEVEYKRSYE